MLSLRFSRLATGEKGAVMVTVALVLPVLILFASFVIDVGNWFVHKRHLQLQADAAALAAAGDVRYPCDGAIYGHIKDTAIKYSGAEEGGYNQQVGSDSSFNTVNFALNSENYPEQQPLVIGGSSCETGTIDVKLTDTERPLFFRVAGLLEGGGPLINAHARVQIFETGSLKGALPIAVPDPNPRKVHATFFNEETGVDIESGELSYKETTEGLAIWTNESEPLLLKVDTAKIGVRLALSGVESISCSDPLVQCYTPSGEGLLFARGYSMERSGAQPSAPQARSVYLEQGTCGDPYFSGGGCSVVLHADVDFGPCTGIEAKVGARLEAVASGKKYPLKWNGSCASDGASEWVASVPVGSEAGPVPIELEWEETKGEEGGNKCKESGNRCKDSFGIVQRSFAMNKAGSGPIQMARVEAFGLKGSERDNSLEGCSAVQSECTYPVVVKIGIDQSLGELRENARSIDEEPVKLRIRSESEGRSHTQSLDCEPHEGGGNSNLRNQLAYGCTPTYTRNEGTECPAQSSALLASPEPWECVAIQTGETKGQVFDGMSLRVFGERNPESCSSPNEWGKFPEFKSGDPRIVPVFLTAFGSFNGSGSGTVPVTGFATFYVTGWADETKSSLSICDGTHGEEKDDEAESGTIIGHFIKYVNPLNQGGASEKLCDFSSPTQCEPVLVE